MEIEFNTSRIPKPVYAEPVAQRRAVPSDPPTAPTPSATDLEQKLNDIPAVRPEQVDHAKELVTDAKYPPDYVLDRIAVLLAIHLKQ